MSKPTLSNTERYSSSIDSVETHAAADRRVRMVVSNTRHLSVSQIIRRGSRMLNVLLAARLLGVATFGVYALLLTIVELLAVVSGSGYMDFLTREVAKAPQDARPLARKVIGLRIAYILPVVVIALVSLRALRFPEALIVNAALLALTLFPRALAESGMGVVKGVQQFSPVPWVEAVQGSVLVALTGTLLLLGFGLRGVVIAEIAAVCAAAVASGIAVRRFAPASSGRRFRLPEVARATWAFSIFPLIGSVYDRIDVVLLSKLAGSFATGIYSAPYRGYSSLQIITYSLMGALLPQLSSSTRESARERCAQAMKVLWALALMIVIGTMVYAKPMVLLLLGPKYFASIAILKILTWAVIPMFISYSLSIFFMAMHKEKVFLLTSSICTIFNLAANLVLIPRYSYFAAAVVTVATEILLLLMNLLISHRMFGGILLPKNSTRITAVFAAVLVGFVLLQHWMPEVVAGTIVFVLFSAFAWFENRHIYRVLRGTEH